MISYDTVYTGGSDEIVEKKSRFIAQVFPVETEEEVLQILEETRKKYWDARHNCSAYVIGSRGEITRCSDDGEPGGTAGRPMLEVLTGRRIRNAAVVVTRYFGGVLLGTGGLVRAYTQAVQEGLKNCVIGRMRPGWKLSVTTDYGGIGKVLYLLGNVGIQPLSSDYGEKIVLELIVPSESAEAFCGKIVDITDGRAEVEKCQELYYVDKDEAEV